MHQLTRFISFSFVLILTILTGCSSLGETQTSGQGVSIKMVDSLLNDPEMAQEVRERELMETMHRYITHRFKEEGISKDLQVNIIITSMRLRTSIWSPGTDHIKTDVVVMKNGAEVKKFNVGSVSARGRGATTKAMSKDLARKMTPLLKELN